MARKAGVRAVRAGAAGDSLPKSSRLRVTTDAPVAAWHTARCPLHALLMLLPNAPAARTPAHLLSIPLYVWCHPLAPPPHTHTHTTTTAGFSSVEVFRKYLWFLLRERQYDAEALADLVALKGALGLTDDQVGEPGL